jgi:hypothetical protein
MQLREFDPNQPLQTTDHFIRDRKRTTREFDSNRALHIIPSLQFGTGKCSQSRRITTQGSRTSSRIQEIPEEEMELDLSDQTAKPYKPRIQQITS